MIEVITREEKAPKIRKMGLIPGVLYGKKSAKIAIKAKDEKELKEGEEIEFILEGQKYRGIIKEVQKDPLLDKVIHFDLYISE